MPAQEQRTVEHLAEVFERCQEEIISEWRRQATELLRELKLYRGSSLLYVIHV